MQDLDKTVIESSLALNTRFRILKMMYEDEVRKNKELKAQIAQTEETDSEELIAILIKVIEYYGEEIVRLRKEAKDADTNGGDGG